jgi:hypothetical protein
MPDAVRQQRNTDSQFHSHCLRNHSHHNQLRFPPEACENLRVPEQALLPHNLRDDPVQRLPDAVHQERHHKQPGPDLVGVLHHGPGGVPVPPGAKLVGGVVGEVGRVPPPDDEEDDTWKEEGGAKNTCLGLHTSLVGSDAWQDLCGEIKV